MGLLGILKGLFGPPVPTLSAAEALERIGQADVVFVDVREPDVGEHSVEIRAGEELQSLVAAVGGSHLVAGLVQGLGYRAAPVRIVLNQENFRFYVCFGSHISQ